MRMISVPRVLKVVSCGLLMLMALGTGVARADVTVTNTVDLTTAGASDCTLTAYTGGTFCATQITNQPTGSGVIDSFLRIDGNNNPSEAGYNVAPNAVGTLDDVGGQFTNILYASAVQGSYTNIGGTLYATFMLDINQTNSDPYLTLNQVQIFSGTAPATTYTGAPCDSSTKNTGCSVTPYVDLAGQTQIWAMNDTTGSTTQNYSIKLDYSLNSGSGTGDMYLYVPATVFSGLASDSYITLFSQFGSPTGALGTGQNDGYEEWSVITTNPVPEPGSILLFGTFLVGAGIWARKRHQAS